MNSEWYFSSISFSTVEVLITFYENRLKDHYVVTPPVLQGLRALVSVCVWWISINILNILYDINWCLHLQVSYWDSFWETGTMMLHWPTCTMFVLLLFPDKMCSIAHRLSCVHAEVSVPGCSCPGETFELRLESNFVTSVQTQLFISSEKIVSNLQ